MKRKITLHDIHKMTRNILHEEKWKERFRRFLRLPVSADIRERNRSEIHTTVKNRDATFFRTLSLQEYLRAAVEKYESEKGTFITREQFSRTRGVSH